MKGVQNTFRNEVNAVCSTIEEMGNPFADQTGDLFVLDTRDIADSKVVKTVRTVEQLGKDQYQQFVTKTGCTREQHHCLIQKNKLSLFSSPPATKEKSSDKLKIASLKSNCSLFSSLCVSCQVRDGDLEGFFGYENQSFPPSLSTRYGKLRSGTKSDLLSCLKNNGPAQAQRPSV